MRCSRQAKLPPELSCRGQLFFTVSDFKIDNGKTIGYLFCLQRDGIGAAYARSLHIPQVMHGTGADRQILSGIAMYYKPEELVGKTLVAIVNLPPRKMMGLESQGMLISAVHTEKGEEKLHLIMVDDAIPAGAKLC